MALINSWVWSPSKAAFYPEDWKALYVAKGTWPSDAVPVSTAIRDANASTINDGKMLAADAKGEPTRVVIPSP